MSRDMGHLAAARKANTHRPRQKFKFPLQDPLRRTKMSRQKNPPADPLLHTNSKHKTIEIAIEQTLKTTSNRKPRARHKSAQTRLKTSNPTTARSKSPHFILVPRVDLITCNRFGSFIAYRSQTSAGRNQTTHARSYLSLDLIKPSPIASSWRLGLQQKRPFYTTKSCPPVLVVNQRKKSEQTTTRRERRNRASVG